MICTPDSGFLNVTAGQPDVYRVSALPDSRIYNSVIEITQEFVDQNQCMNSYTYPRGGGVALFRTASDLLLLNEQEHFQILDYEGTTTT